MADTRLRIQSAMEYLMTYGWAILIIAVVLGALFGLGFFNYANLAPKVAAGSCQVYRPNGPGTTSFINLEGTCNNQLPQYVAQFSGGKEFITIPNPDDYDYGVFTVTAWVNTNTPGFSTLIGREMSTQGWNFLIDSSSALGIRVDTSTCSGCAIYPTAPSVNDGRWHFVAAVINLAGTNYLYQDGVQTGTRGTFGGQFTQTGGSMNIMEMGQGTGCCSNGGVADVQLYNTSLSANEILALYQEGIGGMPLVLNNLVGWWQLNGNANDYSGNQNNGVPTNIVFTTSWTSTYTAP